MWRSFQTLDMLQRAKRGLFMTISIAESISIAGVGISEPRFEMQRVPRLRIRHDDRGTIFH